MSENSRKKVQKTFWKIAHMKSISKTKQKVKFYEREEF